MKFHNKYSTNNFNICINVNKSQGNFQNIQYLHDKVTELSSNLSLLESNVANLTSISIFQENLDQFFNFTERSKIKNLINGTSFEKLQSYVAQYDQFNTLLQAGHKLSYKESMIYLTDYNQDQTAPVSAQIDGQLYQLNDLFNSDFDTDTVYKIPIPGFIIGVQIFSSTSNNSSMETFFGAKTSYNSLTNTSFLYLTKDDYQLIYERAPNNKIRVHSLIIQ